MTATEGKAPLHADDMLAVISLAGLLLTAKSDIATDEQIERARDVSGSALSDAELGFMAAALAGLFIQAGGSLDGVPSVIGGRSR